MLNSSLYCAARKIREQIFILIKNVIRGYLLIWLRRLKGLKKVQMKIKAPAN